MERGELSELARKMDEIEKRQGLAPHEYWPARQGPPDYEPLRDQGDALLDKINDTILLHVLRLYRFDYIADLFERDHATYETMLEAGRIFLYRDARQP